MWNFNGFVSHYNFNKMNIIYPFLIVILFASCHNKEKQVTHWPEASLPAIAPILDYDSCKREIATVKQQNKKGWTRLSLLQKEKIFTAAVAKTIIPGWIGTAWDFNGVTETPGKGKIACGYFVTTVLRDAGLPITRIKLAQCASEQMITTLVQSKFVQRFSNLPIDDFINAVKAKGYGLYLVGLDNHTGFIYNDGTAVYFIHSTFVGTRNVQQELAAASWVLAKSRYKVLGKISADEKVLNKWME